MAAAAAAAAALGGPTDSFTITVTIVTDCLTFKGTEVWWMEICTAWMLTLTSVQSRVHKRLCSATRPWELERLRR